MPYDWGRYDDLALPAMPWNKFQEVPNKVLTWIASGNSDMIAQCTTIYLYHIMLLLDTINDKVIITNTPRVIPCDCRIKKMWWLCVASHRMKTGWQYREILQKYINDTGLVVTPCIYLYCMSKILKHTGKDMNYVSN